MNISVIIPAFNAEKYIDKCLDYLLNQDYKLNYEIIIVDDGSKDETLKILKKYEKKHPNIKVISQKNSGQAVARNRAIDLAKGKYLMFVDIDDFVDKTILSKMFSVIDKENADLVYCDYYEYYGDDKLILKENYFTDDSKKNGILANFAPWGKLYRTEFLKKSGLRFLEGKLFEDIAIVPVLAALSNKSIRLAEPLYYYNCSNVSSIRKKTYNKKLEDVPEEIQNDFEKSISLRIIDKYWMDQLDAMEELKEGVGLRGYAQSNPLQVYALEGFQMFDNMMASINAEISTFLLNAEVRQNLEREEVKNIQTNDGDKASKKQPKKSEKKVGRNDPCPCGSGKKYKQCCGK